jgi:hypothetical protein
MALAGLGGVMAALLVLAINIRRKQDMTIEWFQSQGRLNTSGGQ